MGIFDVFKTKVSEAADKAGDVAEKTLDKAGDVAGDMKDKVSDMRGGDKPDQPVAEAEAARMVSEGAPVADTGEAAPGAGDDGLIGTIKQNVAGGAEKAGGFVDDKTDNRFSDQIDTGVRAVKDKLR